MRFCPCFYHLRNLGLLGKFIGVSFTNNAPSDLIGNPHFTNLRCKFQMSLEAWIEDHDWFASTSFSSVAVFLGVGDFSRMVVGPDIKSQFPFFQVFLSLLFWQINTKSTSGGISLFFPAILGKFSFILKPRSISTTNVHRFFLGFEPEKNMKCFY